MIRCGVVTCLFLFTFLQAGAQVKGSVNVSYGLSNSVNLGDYVEHHKSVFPFIVGVSFESKLSKKQYASWSLHARYGVRFHRSGFGIKNYLSDYKDFSENNNINFLSDVESSLIQSYVGLPAGFELRFNPNPVLRPGRPAFSITLLLNNSLMLSAKFRERVDHEDLGWLRQSGNFKSYTGLYHLGYTVDFTLFRFLNAGIIHQPVSYKDARSKFNFQGQSQSPFFELVADNETYRDFMFYMGVNVPLSVFNRKGK
ncbi:MAG TPA: hypothetical protein VFM90_06615 [Cyclobacteriaceae bacterium]|nr:hypothetical protein [Cyclobacteriaceae bacterium]